MSVSALLLGASQIFFVINFFWSFYRGKKAETNPWHANTLEWATSSPPPHGNWAGPAPTVYRGPYEFSSPEVEEDYFPQNVPHPFSLGAPAPAGMAGH